MLVSSKAMDDNNIVDFVDKAIGNNSLEGAKEVVRLALLCVEISPKRPSMRTIVEELERIQEKEIGRLHFETGEEIGAVTPGSGLFKRALLVVWYVAFFSVIIL
ncbi:hypothetical protein DITRI_Ditri05aG0018400 [Diplodiscus trichospermus]